jgi:hypothetical protein
MVLHELPVREPGRLVTLSFAVGSNRANNYMAYPHFAAMRDRNQTLGLARQPGDGATSTVTNPDDQLALSN